MVMESTALTEDLRVRIHRHNRDYLMLVCTLARQVPGGAASIIGSQMEVVDVLRETPYTMLSPLGNTDMLITRLRVTSPDLWQKLRDGRVDTNQLLQEFLKTMPEDLK